MGIRLEGIHKIASDQYRIKDHIVGKYIVVVKFDDIVSISSKIFLGQ